MFLNLLAAQIIDSYEVCDLKGRARLSRARIVVQTINEAV